jgi:hypothetical protein
MPGLPKTDQNRSKNANDHEQRARVHPAQPDYSVVVPAPELSSIDVAVNNQMGMAVTFRKGVAHARAYCGTSRTTGPLATGGGGAADCAVGSAFAAGFGGLPIGPYMKAIASTAAATIVPKMPATFCEFISIPRRLPDAVSQKTTDMASGVQQNLIGPCWDARTKLARTKLEWLMPPAVNAAVFLFLGLAAIWGIGKNLTTGTASSRGWTCTLDDNPVSFCLIVAMKGAVLGFAIDEILYGLGLIGDPIVQIRHALPFLA